MLVDIQSTTNVEPYKIPIEFNHQNFFEVENTLIIRPFDLDIGVLSNNIFISATQNTSVEDFKREVTYSNATQRKVKRFDIDLKIKAYKEKYESPIKHVVQEFEEIVELLSSKGIEPNAYGPSIEGGVIFDFYNNDKYTVIELFNDGSSTLYISEKATGKPIAMEDLELIDVQSVIVDYL